MKRILWVFVGILLGLGTSVVGAQGPTRPAAGAPGPVAPAPPSCEQQLNEELFKVGGLTQQLAVAREQLRFAQKERDDLKASLAKPAAQPATPAEQKK